MHITFLTRLDGGLYYGGAEVQAENTAHHLRALGVQVDFFTPLSRQVGDIVHAFGPYAYFGSVAEYCRSRCKPFILSTIFYKDTSLLRLRLRYQIYKLFPKSIPQFRSLRRLFRHARMLLPNTRAEAIQLQQIFRVPAQRIEVIPNGVEACFAQADPDWFAVRQAFASRLCFVWDGLSRARISIG